MKETNTRKAKSEKAILEMVRGRARRFGQVRVGIGDDCAVVGCRAGEEMVVTTDFSIEGRHFHRGWHPAEAVGHKCLARGLSDIASMGGRPVAAFVSLALPREMTVASRGGSWVERFYTGLLGLARTYGVTLAGGDLSSAPLIVADIVVMGAAPTGRALLRSGAKAGDGIYVTGRLGGAMAEYAARSVDWKPGVEPKKRPGYVTSVLRALGTQDWAKHPHFLPQPRADAGRALLKRGLASACIDISDGLSTDLEHLCEASGVSAEIDAGAVPLFPGAMLEQALHGGDDYELLFTARAEERVPRVIAGTPVRAIGRVLSSRRGGPRMVLVEDGRRSELRAGGWQHFQGETK